MTYWMNAEYACKLNTCKIISNDLIDTTLSIEDDISTSLVLTASRSSWVLRIKCAADLKQN